MKAWHDDYRARYAALKAAGKPFFPYAVFKDAVVALALFAVLSYLAVYHGAKLEELADPTDATYNPRPEWYFLFLFQALKYFPGYMEAVVAVFAPGVAIAILFLVPLWDAGPARHPLDRPFWTSLCAASIAGCLFLTWEGYRSPLTNPIVERDPLIQAGQKLYADLKCVYCHAVGGQGGRMGPDLSRIGHDKPEDWVARHFSDPQGVVPGSGMPRFTLLPGEGKALVAYVRSLSEGMNFSAEAPVLFSEYCSACHRVKGEGGDIGPDLSLIGTARDRTYLRQYVADPSRLNHDATMPGYQGQLTGEQMEDLARFMSSLGR